MSVAHSGQCDLTLINGLMRSGAFPHAVASVEMIETHISWVLLAGDYAYKIKKPLSLGFLDFRDLEKRRFYCEEEIRLNQPWAPDIYIGVVKIVLVNGQSKIDIDGKAVEYSVKMRRFDQALRLDKQLENDLLSAEDMRELAENVAYRHRKVEPVPAGMRARALELTESLMWDNFTALRSSITDVEFSTLHVWTQRELDRLRSVIGERFDQGYYRDCHGDLHLANLVRLPSGITTFDCIEFSSDLRYIDVTCDLAFLVMDLESKGRDDLAAHFLNRYLEQSGDYGGLRLFDLYFVYRCLVRAKVAAIRAGERTSEQGRLKDIAEVGRYREMAARQTLVRQPVLVVMHGLSGSGKTWISGRLMSSLPAIRVRSDLMRKQLFGLAETAQSGSALAAGIYTPGSNADVYAIMCNHADSILRAGHNVILDATFLHHVDRDKVRKLAKACRASFVIVRATAPADELRRRIRARKDRHVDASEASVPVLDHQLQTIEPLTPVERRYTISVDSRDSSALNELPDRLRTMTANYSAEYAD